MIELIGGRLLILVPVALVALVISLELIVLLRPWLVRHALARPNARSSHQAPTPQGAGIAVVVATLAVSWAALAFAPVWDQGGQFLIVTAAAVLLAVVGAVDDMQSLPATPRLAVQCVAVGAVIAALPGDLVPQIPSWMERAGLFIGGLWFVNLVNFMDGIDWMTVVEFVPVTGAIVLLGLFGKVGLLPALLSAALLGAVLGFAPFNKPVAQIFLGDVGSLPLGLLLGWLLLQLAAKGHLLAALILPLYYLADATITLGRRVVRGEPFWRAHRSHFYQRAIDNGFSVPEIVTRVFAVNLALAAFALIAVIAPPIAVVVLLAAAAMVAWLLLTFARRR